MLQWDKIAEVVTFSRKEKKFNYISFTPYSQGLLYVQGVSINNLALAIIITIENSIYQN